MIYIYVGIALSIWFSLVGMVTVLRPRLKYLVIALPISIAFFMGTFANFIDFHFGYEAGPFQFLAFYKFLFMKNWAYSISIICGALTSFELAKFMARKYRVRNPKRHVTTAEFIQDLP